MKCGINVKILIFPDISVGGCHIFIYLVNIECLPQAKHCSRHLGSLRNETDQNACFYVLNVLVREDSTHKQNKQVYCVVRQKVIRDMEKRTSIGELEEVEMRVEG